MNATISPRWAATCSKSVSWTVFGAVSSAPWNTITSGRGFDDRPGEDTRYARVRPSGVCTVNSTAVASACAGADCAAAAPQPAMPAARPRVATAGKSALSTRRAKSLTADLCLSMDSSLDVRQRLVVGNRATDREDVPVVALTPVHALAGSATEDDLMHPRL